MLYRFHLLFLAWVLAASSAVGQRVAEFQTLIEQWRTAMDIPGMSVGIIHKGEVLLESGFGVLEKGGSARADAHTLYAIASNTKAFVAAAIATLVEDGRLSWDDPVQRHLPYFGLYDPCVSGMVTVRDLLCHRAGLGTFSGDAIWYRSQYSAEEVVRRARFIPQAFDFRNGFGYSNVMYITAGEVIRAVTGQSWDAYVRDVFLQPLGMDRTLTSIETLPQTANVATPHLLTPTGDQPTDWVQWNAPGAAGGILSSVHDMLAWVNMQLDGGLADTDTFFSAVSQRTMWTPHVNYPVTQAVRDRFGGRDFNGYGLGWGTTEYFNHFMVSHTGGYDGMYSAVTLLPGQKTAVVVLTNSMKSVGTLLAYEIFDRLLGLPQHEWLETAKRQHLDGLEDRRQRIDARHQARVAGTAPSLDADAVSGLYRCPMYGDVRILEEDGTLWLDFPMAPDLKARLSHWHHNTWEIHWMKDQPWFGFGTVQVRTDNDGRPESLLFDVPNDDIFFHEINAVRVGS